MTATIVSECQERLRRQVESGWEILSESPLVVAPPHGRPGFRSNVLLFLPETRETDLPEPQTLDVVVADNEALLADGAVRRQVVLTHFDGVPIMQEMVATVDDDTTVQLIASIALHDSETCEPLMADLRALVEAGSDV